MNNKVNSEIVYYRINVKWTVKCVSKHYYNFARALSL